jgi:hypothetical protein
VDATNLRSEVPIGARTRRDQNREAHTRRLPDGTLHCPPCGSEVQPLGAPSTPSGPGYHGEAYWAGWVDGRFREFGSFVSNPNLARWATPSERLDYYRGHRTGREACRRGGRSKAHEGSSGSTRP